MFIQVIDKEKDLDRGKHKDFNKKINENSKNHKLKINKNECRGPPQKVIQVHPIVVRSKHNLS